MLLAAGLALFAATAAEPPCRAHEQGKALDFWLGEWTVTSEDGGTHFGDNRIELAVGGCAVFEHWKSAAGGEGKSLFAFDARSGRWEQVWVTSDTTKPGSLKHKSLTGHVDASVRFQGEIIPHSGEPYLDRTTLTPLEDGRVRQLIEISTDGGENWKATFDGYYRRNAE
ncbi:MAG: hypothetical protein ACOZAA_12320 [Pseudomonadota bacterium]